MINWLVKKLSCFATQSRKNWFLKKYFFSTLKILSKQPLSPQSDVAPAMGFFDQGLRAPTVDSAEVGSTHP